MGSERRVLVITGPPTVFGGIAVQARGLAEFLRAQGYYVTIAHYATLRSEVQLTVPAHRILYGKTARIRRYTVWGDFDCISIGCWLPELEATYYRDSLLWRSVVAEHDRHIAVGGNPLVAAPLAASGLAHLVWCASDVQGDRVDRQNAMSSLRRVYDRNVVSPLLRSLEARVLKGRGTFATISSASAKSLGQLGERAKKKFDVLPIPIDLVSFSPPDTPPKFGIVGIAGRHTDPRKNASLALQSVAAARRHGAKISLRIAGNVSNELRALAISLGLSDAVNFLGRISDEDLPEFYRGLDIFLIPSRQEGLNIAGLEAGACGVPVVTTCCGGPEDYVLDGETGFVTGFDPVEIASRITDISNARTLRERFSRNIRAIVKSKYSEAEFAYKLGHLWQSIWNEPFPAISGYPQLETAGTKMKSIR